MTLRRFRYEHLTPTETWEKDGRGEVSIVFFRDFEGRTTIRTVYSFMSFARNLGEGGVQGPAFYSMSDDRDTDASKLTAALMGAFGGDHAPASVGVDATIGEVAEQAQYFLCHQDQMTPAGAAYARAIRQKQASKTHFLYLASHIREPFIKLGMSISPGVRMSQLEDWRFHSAYKAGPRSDTLRLERSARRQLQETLGFRPSAEAHSHLGEGWTEILPTTTEVAGSHLRFLGLDPVTLEQVIDLKREASLASTKRFERSRVHEGSDWLPDRPLAGDDEPDEVDEVVYEFEIEIPWPEELRALAQEQRIDLDDL